MSKANTEEMKAAFAEALQWHMNVRGVSQAELSRLSGIPHDRISRYFNGKMVPRAAIQDKLAEALGCSRADFRGHHSTQVEGSDFLRFYSSDAVEGANRVTIEMRKKLSLDQVARIIQIVNGAQSAARG